MINLVKYNKFKSQEVAMLTFSKNTQQDFIRRIDKIDTDKLINTDNIRTIDSLANKIIGVDGTIDVNLLSYKFKKYLEDTKTDDLVKNKDLNQIKILFVDEAQDLNETQFNIISNLNKKLKIMILPQWSTFDFLDIFLNFFTCLAKLRAFLSNSNKLFIFTDDIIKPSFCSG